MAQYYIIYRSREPNQKGKENQWRVADLQEFLYTALLYQAMINRNINAATSLKQYSVLFEKEQWGDFLHGCRDRPIMLIFYLLCYAAVLKFLTYYAQYYAHVKELCLKFDCSIRVYSLV